MESPEPATPRDLAPGAARQLGCLGPVSALGLGSFAGEPGEPDDTNYELATIRAVERGITLLDTGINYRLQGSERAIGRALREIRARRRSTGARSTGAGTGTGTVATDSTNAGNAGSATELAQTTPRVCTRGGYIPLENPPPESKAKYLAYVSSEYFDHAIIYPDELVSDGHCIVPSFLVDQVDRSRRNLGVSVIDLYYVHNPEQQLDGVSRDVLTRRIRDAFAALEECVDAGSILAYGCATWHGLRVPPDAPNHLSLEALVSAAREVAGEDHHFTAVQVPISLAMSEAIRVRTQVVRGAPRTLLEAATELGVAVVACAPLLHGQLAAGLPRAVRDAFPDARDDAERALRFTLSLPQVVSTVVGMRSVSHVDRNSALLA